MSLAAFAAFAVLASAGCGNTYRPVVTSISPVGPAGQPTKYAVAISSASPTANGLVTLVDFSGDTILNTTLIGLNPYFFQLSNASTGVTLNSDGTLTSFNISPSLLASQVLQSTLLPGSNPVSITPAGASQLYIAEAGRNATAQLAGLPPAIVQELPTGAGSIYTVGNSGAPRIFSLVVGSSPTSNGKAVTIDTTSNTITNSIPVGANPTYGVMSSDTRRAFILNKGSNNVTVINAQANALDAFGTASFTGTTTAGSPNITAVSSIAGLAAGQTVSGTGIPTGTTIVSATGSTVVLSANATSSSTGALSAGSNTIPVGVAPIWADFAPTLNELLVANQGAPEFGITSYSISSNVATFQTSAQNLTAGQQLTLLNFPTSTFLNGQTVTVSATGLSGNTFQVPLTHANASASEAGNGIGNGSVTIISVPLCSQSTVVTNPNCDPNNPIDAIGFGTIVATIPVGPSPIMIGVMQDGTGAYVANAGVLPTAATSTAPATPGTPGSVSAISLNTNTVIATVPGANSTNATDGFVHGHPLYMGVLTGTPTGKVYVVSSDSTDLSIIRSDINAIQTHLSLQGFGVSLRFPTP